MGIFAIIILKYQVTKKGNTMKKNNYIALIPVSTLLILVAFNINNLNDDTIFGLSPDFFKGILIGLSITINILVIVKLLKKSKQTKKTPRHRHTPPPTTRDTRLAQPATRRDAPGTESWPKGMRQMDEGGREPDVKKTKGRRQESRDVRCVKDGRSHRDPTSRVQ